MKSQWDFGELFAPAATRRVWTVTELTSKIRRLLEQQLGQVWVSGEVTNLRVQSSGHIYFTLKDAGAQLSCVLFRGETVAHRDLIQDGQKVLVQGDLTVYEPRGQYQLVVRNVELQGIGALQLAFEKLKRKLQAQGLFAPERKRTLPRYPQRIGIVTSPTGAAIRDVAHVVRRRNPGLELVLAPCRVQGSGAAEEIADAIRLLNQWSQSQSPPGRPCLDLILVTRGGGSLEDLWAFNEEIVARTIFESNLPVISAVGHEIDFTISDFVADVRAATPSAAAEIITESAFASRQFLVESKNRLRQLARTRLKRERDNCQQLNLRLARAHPRRRLNEKWQRLDDLHAALVRRLKYRRRDYLMRWQGLHQRFLRMRPSQILMQRRHNLGQAQRRLREQVTFRLQAKQNRFANVVSRLCLLSPLNVLERGYSITMNAATGVVLRSPEEVGAGQRLKTLLQTGEIHSIVEG
jgi:exodeoxyribonuclease VII large subunit